MRQGPGLVFPREPAWSEADADSAWPGRRHGEIVMGQVPGCRCARPVCAGGSCPRLAEHCAEAFGCPARTPPPAACACWLEGADGGRGYEL